jgi:hypothetical protein
MENTAAGDHENGCHGGALAIRHNARIIPLAVSAEDDKQFAFGSEPGNHHGASRQTQTSTPSGLPLASRLRQADAANRSRFSLNLFSTRPPAARLNSRSASASISRDEIAQSA